MISKFNIKGLDCANCAAELDRKIQKMKEVKNISINFMTQRMEVEYDEIEKEEIIEKMKRIIKKEEPDVEIEEQ